MDHTSSPENQRVLDLKDEIGFERLGIMSSQAWFDDPQSLLFTLSRYKFVSRILRGKKLVLEVGCGDGFSSRLVQQQVRELQLSDHDPIFIDDIKLRNPSQWSLESFVFNPLRDKIRCLNSYDGIYLLDVLEHIAHTQEHSFLENILPGLSSDGTFIVGMPSLASQKYASEISKAGHVNCKSGSQLYELMSLYFSNVQIFSMNDEVVHTGFWDMAHYLFAVCCLKK